MGVEGFYGNWLKQQYPGTVKKVLPNGKGVFLETLTYDMGGLMHGVAQEVYSYGDHYNKARADIVGASLKTEKGRTVLMTNFCVTVTNRITQLTKAFIREVNPDYKRVYNLVIAMDGCAPFAKVAQQRTRRYKATLPADAPAAGEKVFMPPPAGWHSNALTPGTELMLMFDEHLKLWAAGDARQLAQHKVIVSTSQQRGEGEHKLFDFRRQELYSTSEGGIIGIYGLDADIIMLESIFPSERVYMIREKNKNTHKDEGNEIHAGIIDIDQYRLELISSMTGLDDFTKMKDINFYSYVRDFVLLTFLIGDDFLPHILCMFDAPKDLNLFIQIYREIIYVDDDTSKKRNFNKPREGHLTLEDGSINWPSLLLFLEALKDHELPELELIAEKIGNPRNKFNMIYPSLQQATTVVHVPESKDRPAKTKYKVNFDHFRGYFYSAALGPKTDAMREFLMAEDIIPFFNEEVMDMCKCYLNGLQWNIMYYTLGTTKISRSWYYPYTQSPTLSDIYIMCKDMVEKDTPPSKINLEYYEGDPDFGPVHQLLTVMPPNSSDLIDDRFAELLDVKDGKFGRLTYISPYKFSVDKEGTKRSHQGLAMLPTIDPAEIVKWVKTIKLSNRQANKIYVGSMEDTLHNITVNHNDSIRYERRNFNRAGDSGSKSGGYRRQPKAAAESRDRDRDRDRDRKSNNAAPPPEPAEPKRNKPTAKKDSAASTGSGSRTVKHNFPQAVFAKSPTKK